MPIYPAVGDKIAHYSLGSIYHGHICDVKDDVDLPEKQRIRVVLLNIAKRSPTLFWACADDYAFDVDTMQWLPIEENTDGAAYPKLFEVVQQSCFNAVIQSRNGNCEV